MIIGYGMPTVAGWETDGSIITNPELLTDGHVSAQCDLELTGIGSSITDYVTLAPSLLGSPDWTFGALVIRNITGLPPGAKITATFGATTHTMTTVANDSGEIDAYWIVPENTPLIGSDTVVLQIYYNSINGSFVQFVGPHIQIGEIWFGQTASFNVKNSLSYSFLNNTKIRYSAGGQQNPLLNPRVRTLGFDLTPQTRQNTLNNTATDVGIDLNTLVKRLTESATLFFAPFSSIPFNGFTVNGNSSDQLLADTAFLGQLTTAPTFKSDQKYFQVHMDAAETL